MDVTIVILSCDRPELFSLALQSALGQTHPAAVLVSDDSAHPDVRGIVGQCRGDVSYLRGPRAGQLANLLMAFAHVETRWAIVLHDDDLLSSTCVADLLGAVTAQPERPDLVIADNACIDIVGNRLGEFGAARARRRAAFRTGLNHLSFDERCQAFLVQGAVSPFLGALLPSAVVRQWRPHPQVGSVLDLSLCEHLVRNVDAVSYVPRDLASYRIHDGSVGSTFADLEPLLFIIDAMLDDGSLRSIWPALVERRADAIARQARVWTAAGKWRQARDLLLQRRPELPLSQLGPAALLTLPVLRSMYGRRIRRANPRFAARTH